jgi:hypothetical protein
LTTLRRFLVLATLFFWQGGLTFYGAVVIPIGARILGSHRSQAVITREVVQVATGVGLLALLLFFWDVLATRDPAGWRRLGRQFLATTVAFTWVVLSCLQLILDSRFDPESLSVEDLPSFQQLHRLYLWITTVQWVLCLLYLLAAVLAWRAEDRAAGANQAGSGPAALGSPHFLVYPDATSVEDREGKREFR